LEHGGEVSGVAFTYDNQFVATAGADGLVWLWDLTGEKMFSLDNSEPIFSVAISPTNSLLFTGLHDKIKVWDITSQELITELPQMGDINTITINSNGTLLATGSTENSIILWDITDEGKITQRKGLLELNGEPRALAFSPDSNWLAGGGFAGPGLLDLPRQALAEDHQGPIALSRHPRGRTLDKRARFGERSALEIERPQ